MRTPDPDLVPIRGQLVVVENLGITEFFSEGTGLSTDLLHYAPHGQTMILGGTAQPDVWNREPDPAVATRIVERCAAVEPRLRDAQVIEHRVGLRPTRPLRACLGRHGGWRPRCPQLRATAEPGVTLSWGFAIEVAEMINNESVPGQGRSSPTDRTKR